MSSLAQLHRLEDRYPFDEAELEILLRCHTSITNSDHPCGLSFLQKLAHSSPYASFFLPGDEVKNRVELVETTVLPFGFGENLKRAIFSDAFPELAHSVEDEHLEKFIEGIADCGRRGPREALRVLYDVASEGKNVVAPADIVRLCYRLSVAADVLVEPSVDEEAIASHLYGDAAVVDPLARSLAAGRTLVMKADFVDWADDQVPILAFTVLTFVQHLIFHNKPIPAGKTPYVMPKLDQATEVFESKDSPLLFALGSMTPKYGGIWHRLYSTEQDGRSFNRMEWSILGYEGPTSFLIKTEDGATLGAFASSPFKETLAFHGDGESFLFQLAPTTNVFHSVGKDSNFMYLHPTWAKGDGLPHGLGFGGTTNQPRLFISEDFNNCIASALDDTFQKGNLLPEEALERFHIKSMEVWGVGGDQVIVKALEKREKYRQQTDTQVYNARHITDKSDFLPDLKSGLVDSKLYKHREQTRGRAEFVYDSKHGGYALERKEGEESVPFPNEDYFNKAQ